MNVYLDFPEYFAPNSIVRADLLDVKDGIIRRKLIPKINRKPDNYVIEITKIMGDFKYHFDVILGKKQGFHPFVTEYEITLDCNNRLCLFFALDMSAVPCPENNPFLYREDGTSHYFQKKLERLASYMERDSTDGEYQKRVFHDQLVPKDLYLDLYYVLKESFASKIIKMWKDSGQSTDSSKHVFEELGIATFLILAFVLYSPNRIKPIHKKTSDEGIFNNKSFQKLSNVISELSLINDNVHNINWCQLSECSFVDMGCGNGMLTFVLNSLGICGYGVDIWKRSIWDNFQQNDGSVNLRAHPVKPDFKLDETMVTNNVWLIGNHSDELTPWIPVIANNMCTDDRNVGFFVIPCCFHDLYGYKNFPAKWTVEGWDGQSDDLVLYGRYAKYLAYIEASINRAGYSSKREYLRIPSTKNVGILGQMKDVYESRDYAQHLINNVPFLARLSDREKSLLETRKKELKKDLNEVKILEFQELNLWD